MRKKGNLVAKPPRQFFKTTHFALAINVNDILFGTTVVLEKRRKFEGFFVLSKEFT